MALLRPLHTLLITDPLLKTTCSHILFSLLLPSLIFSHSPPRKNQVLCKLESWKEVQKSDLKPEGDAEDLELIYRESTFNILINILCVSRCLSHSISDTDWLVCTCSDLWKPFLVGGQYLLKFH